MMRKRDLILIGAALVVALALIAINTLHSRTPGTAFRVDIDGKTVLTGTLSKDASYPVRQPDGSLNIVAVQEGAVFMKEANCRDGLCVRQGKTSSAAKTIVCLPHRLTVTVKVKFVNEKHPEENFEKSFAAYEDYDSTNSIDAVEGQLCDTIVEKLIEDIFNATVANW